MHNYLSVLKKKIFAEITEVPEILADKYYQVIDGWRGLAIMLILLAHTGINHYVRILLNFYVEGRSGVSLFFVISGFLITTLLIKEKIKTQNISLKKFYIRRILRIIPVAYLFLLVLIFLKHYFHLNITLADWVTSFLFLNNLPLKGHLSPYTAHFWSLAVEEQFYLTFPILLAYSFDRYFIVSSTIVILVPIIAILGYYCIDTAHLDPFLRMLIKTAMYAFWKGPLMILIGSVLSIMLFKNILTRRHFPSNFYSGFFILVLSLVIQTPNFIFYTKYLSEYLSAIMLGYTIILGIHSKDLLFRVLTSRLLIKIGVLSYSIYIWQQLFIGNRPWEPWLHSWASFPLIVIILLKLCCVFSIALVSYHVYESRFLRIKEKFKYK